MVWEKACIVACQSTTCGSYHRWLSCLVFMSLQSSFSVPTWPLSGVSDLLSISKQGDFSDICWTPELNTEYSSLINMQSKSRSCIILQHDNYWETIMYLLVRRFGFRSSSHACTVWTRHLQLHHIVPQKVNCYNLIITINSLSRQYKELKVIVTRMKNN